MSRSAVALARLALPNALPTTDAQLLGAFVSSRAEDPFAELVRRHGPMVLAVCRRVLSDAHDAEDAFQATFLVLARKANSVRGSNVAGWLYGVAVRTARGVRVARDRRQKRLSQKPEPGAREQEAGPPPEDALAVAEHAGIIDEELAKLPERYREAVVLCELRGLSRHEAAAELGVPEGTVSSRLASAKRKLAERLAARGLTPAVALAALAGGSATVSAGLVCATAAAVHGAAGGAAGAAADAVLKAMLFEQLRAGALAGAMCLALACGGLAMTGSANAPPADAKATAPAPRPADDNAVNLVQQLGSADFAEREAAEKALRALGPKAEPALKAGLRSDDPEVRTRCAAVLAAVRKDALDALVKQFDPKAEKQPEHPIWTRFQALAGNTPASRELFARILKRAEWGRRLAAAEAGPEAAAQQYREAVVEVGQRYRANLRVFFVIPIWPCDLAQEAAYLLFLGSYPGTETALKGVGGTSAAEFADGEGRLHYAQGLSLGLIGKEIAPGAGIRYDATAALPPGSDRVFWKLLGAWLPRRADASVLFNSFHLALRARAADVLPAARTIAGDEKRSAGERVGALWAVAQFGDTSDLPLFAKLYDDPTEIVLPPPSTGKSPGPRSRRLRADDNALALALLLYDRDPAEFGFRYAKGKLLREGGRPVLANYEAEAFGFSDDKARAAAHAKARAFLAEQKPKPNEKGAPFWSRFAKLLGDDEASRVLFDLIASEPKNLELLERAEALLKKADAPDADPDALFAPEKLYLARRDELNEAAEARKPVPLAAVYGWMYLGTFPRTNHPSKASRVLRFMPQESGKPEQAELVRHLTGPNGSAAKRLLGAWAEHQTANGSSRVALELALRYEIKDALGAARKVLAEALRVRPDDLNGPQIGAALLLVGKYGSEADAPAVTQFLTNAKEFYGHRPGKTTTKFVEGEHISNQVRDTAAVVLIVLRKGKPEDFGFIWTKTEAAKLVPWAGQLGTDPLDMQVIGFSTDPDRAAAHKKVKAWLDKQKPKEQPHPDVAKLVRQLGSADAAEREAAEKQLEHLGAAAKPDLLAGAESDDRDLARRCKAILTAVRKDDWQRARDAFAREPTSFDHPVWQKLKSVTGDGADARAILADLLADEPAFIAIVEALDAPKAAPELHRAAHARLTQNLKDWYAADKARNAVTALAQWAPDRGTYSALLLLGTFPGTGAAPAYRVGAERSQADHAEWHVCWCGLIATNPRPKNGGMRRPSVALQRLFVAWLGARENPDAAASGFSTLLMFECREGSALARTVAADAKRTPRSRGQALLYLGQVGTASDAAVAAQAFDDAREFSSSHERNVQVRDIATAVALELSGEKPAEWGFSVEPRAGAFKNVAPRITGFTSNFARDPFLKAAQEKVAELITARSATPPPRTKP